ncbi:MAG: hypothetical protein V4594_20185 [Bacteroidota bacterium]
MEIVKKAEKFPMSTETDEDLLIIMSMKEDVESSQASFVEFHRRYKDFLYFLVEKTCSNHPNSKELIKVIFNNVLLNVFQYCKSFNCSEKDETIIRKKIMGWLTSIAKTEYKAQFTKTSKKMEEDLVFKSMVKSSISPPKYSYSEDIVGKAFEQIPKDRDRDILRTYWIFYEKGDKSQAKNMPDDALDDLATRYNTTKENIRTIISRTNKIVKAFLENNYKK